MRIASLRSLLPSQIVAAVLFLSACGDGSLRSPDLPPPQLTGIGQVVCTLPGSGNTLAVGQSGQCAVVGGCQYRLVDENGTTRTITGVCPDSLTFRSNDPSTVSTTPDGTVTGEKPGTTTIVAEGDGQTSEPVTVTVSSACATDDPGTLTLNPQAATLRSGRTSGTSQRIQATLRLTDGSVVEGVGVFDGMEWTISNPAVLTAGETQLNKNLFTAAANVAETTVVEVTGTYSGALLCEGVPPQTKTADVTVTPSQLVGNDPSSICIEATPPAQAFEGCRDVTELRRACMTPNQPILLEVGQTRQVQVRGIFDDGRECNITSASELTLNGDDGAVTMDDSGNITGVRATENASLSATYEGVTKERDVLVPVKQVVGKNGFVVFAKAFVQDYDCGEGADASCRRADSLTLEEAKLNKFTCSGPNDLLSLNGGEFATKAFAIAAKCDVEMLVTQADVDAELFDAQDLGKCTAIPEPTEDNPNPTFADRSVEVFETQVQVMTRNVTDGEVPGLAQPITADGIKWTTKAGRWNINTLQCDENGASSALMVGDGNWRGVFGETERVLVADPENPGELLECTEGSELPACQGHDPDSTVNPLQANGLAYAKRGVDLGLACVMAEYTGAEYVGDTPPRDGMTVLVPPALATSIFSDSNLCESLSALVGNPLLGIVDVGGILSGVTGGLSPLFEALDPITGEVDEAVVQGVVQNLTGALNPLLGPINDALLSPVVDDVLLCNLINGVGGLISLLSGNAQPGRDCPAPALP